ncbi:MAG TPA: ATPase, T2SS/T4P/T4SS family [Candidatus Acidoferrales bacterium]|jgi:type IV pilus assembly protein PilB|nr:ATPase, T2SS/T4P/T4SS family [Candidatus Acidoferrales bacterium]
MKKKRLGEALRERGKISAADLQNMIGEQQGRFIHLGELLLDRGIVSKEDLAEALEEVSHVPYFECGSITPEPEILKLIPAAMAERLCVLPMRIENKRLVVCMVAPQNLVTLDELRFTTGLEISPRQSFRNELQAAIAQHYLNQAPRAAEPVLSETMASDGMEEIEFFSTSSRQTNREAIQEMQADLRQRKTPAVLLVSEIIQVAVAKQASDIHIEPRATETIVRVRVDGVLRDIQTIPRNLQTSLISRIKILSDMDIAERRTPQDGRFMVALGTRQLDLRVSALPTQYGEKVVIRLLEASAPLASLFDLGMPTDVSENLWQLVSQPQGMILVTGPTGSGKSTTLYSCLNKLKDPGVNIVTVEDPVEYVLAGINQSHVNVKAGMTFASCLRSILRQDPNIIMVGEIRDRETAEIAMKAAQTGHLVLSTLHTNDSISSIVRLLDLGIPGFLISSSITGILAQRLVRKLCSCHCIQPATPEFLMQLAQAGLTRPPATMAVPIGCEKCDHTGYKGRIGIYELLRLDDSIRALIRSNGNIEQIREISRANGMHMMLEDAFEKLRLGMTSLEEIIRVVPIESVSHAECPQCRHRILPMFKFCPNCGKENAIQRKSPRPGSRHPVRAEILQ